MFFEGESPDNDTYGDYQEGNDTSHLWVQWSGRDEIIEALASQICPCFIYLRAAQRQAHKFEYEYHKARTRIKYCERLSNKDLAHLCHT